MAFKPIYAFTETMKGKKIRFKKAGEFSNLTNQFGISLAHGANMQVPAGALGHIYEVRGGTLFVGFGQNLKTDPPKFSSSSYYSATIQVYLDDIDKLEVEA
jgi:hypothetical protein